MLKWWTRRKRGDELPGYSALHSVLTRELPSELKSEESGDTFGLGRMAIEEELRRTHDDPQSEKTHFTTLEAPGGRGVVTIPMEDRESQCLPVFTTPVRAGDDRQVLLSPRMSVRYRVSTAAQLHGLFGDIEKQVVQHLRQEPA